MFSDDLALDVKGAYRDLIAEGAAPDAAKDALLAQFKDDLADRDSGPVVWLALAVTAWKLGRLDPDTKARALAIIERGDGLALWDSPKLRRDRMQALEKVGRLLASDQPAPVRLKKPKARVTDWQIGEVIGLQTRAGDWTLLHVADHLASGVDRYPVCELLVWRGPTLCPSQNEVNAAGVAPCLPDAKGLPARTDQRFVLMDTDSTAAKGRLARTGLFRKAGRGFLWRLFRKPPARPVVVTVYLGLPYLDGYLDQPAP